TLRLTNSLEQSANALRNPLIATLRKLGEQGDQLAVQADVQTDPAALTQQKKELDALTTQFKQASAAFLPLGKELIVLDLYKRSTSNWRNTVASQYSTQLKGLILRLAVLGIILGVIFGISELWRRTIFRYVHDVRRRYQFLLLRRIVIWSLVAIMIAVAFASELGALTTFAGLLTAGIAVALQNVILSVAGYFFLIGKYGVRIGDRIQISGVTGDVVDIGLVRLHLMEIGSGTGPRATGRVVVFSNAVVFQPTAGLYKQIPGTNFIWHEITLTVAPESDYRAVEKRMLDAVNRVFAGYKDRMEFQRRKMEQTLGTHSAYVLNPESRLHLTPAGMEITIRYPVELENAAEIDDKITRELLDATERQPKLRVIGSTSPVSKAENT
ncbi:MAG TPA: mechanosensitive ion channel family protein, partial [Terriglobales bacterium]